MEYKEDEYLMLSGIQHFKFCRRQWALIHIEQEWGENVHTVIGELMHKKVHDPGLPPSLLLQQCILLKSLLLFPVQYNHLKAGALGDFQS